MNCKSGEQSVLVSGSDFYSARLSPDGKRLAWLSWDHPNLPWDGTHLWVAELNADGSVGQATLVAGGEEKSIFQPEWSPDGVLFFVSDRSGWWNLYRQAGAGVEAIYLFEAEFGMPQWVFGMSTYTFESAERLVCVYTELGNWYLATIDLATRRMTTLDLPYTHIQSPHAMPGKVLLTAGSPSEPASIILLDLATGQRQVLRRSSEIDLPASYFSSPVIEFPTENGLTAYANYYPPANPDYSAPAGERPPLLVLSHGGGPPRRRLPC